MSEVTFKVEGPLFEEETIKMGAKQALNDIGILGVGLVQKELVPGHGFLTGNLYRSISFALQGDDQMTIDSGKSKFGANVVYADYIERGSTYKGGGDFRMFETAFKELTSGNTMGELTEKVIARAMEGDRLRGLGR